ncbi:rRNA methylase, putative, group 3 [Halobacteroides halobius DSM 5150]|uniref:rRNA methylase, putative, group 3 n=1 Tax=Halobacteroides halobius (strain ATCC 35273 / DSM 5150 / MD-1) TaxID=748449 RepID=L0K7T4_HALHC|nr:23S rRNA (guanosine(2251)-2'-O)-methyltransferase RlmB [Halobacteroides halobius]AGB40183.1 rRNA methylase, putative, group 3 [Halobacteroides halobius DSM 5150]
MAQVEGRNPVIEALKGDRKIKEILMLEGAHGAAIDTIYDLAKQEDVEIKKVDKGQLNNMAKSHAHQGVIALAQDLKYWQLDHLVQYAKEKCIAADKEAPFLVLLDEIKDPHNFGAILRICDGAGVDGVIIPKRRAVGFTPAVAKASAGAIEHVPVAQVTNLARSIDQLKDKGFWIAGADISGEQNYFTADLKGSLGLVIGSEGTGMRRLVKEKCDFLVKMPMNGKVDSLNASVAAGILIYDSIRQRMEG